MATGLMDLVETVRAEQASVHQLFGRGDGRSASSARRQLRESETYVEEFTEALELWEKVLGGSRHAMMIFEEAMTTADFPLLFGDIIDRQLLANYREVPQTYRNLARISTVPDFRTVKRFMINHGEERLQPVAQQAEYPETQLTDASASYAVKKFGKAIPFAWEDMINDDLDALKDIPARFARSARRTEEFFAYSLFVSSTGPNATFFSDANHNLIDIANGASVDHPKLSIAGLQDAMTVLANQVDSDGEPILIESVVLVVPPALFVTAQNILNGTELWINLAAAADTQQLHTTNWMRDMVTLQKAYYLPIIDTTHGKTAWYLFANPDVSRPALEVGFLRGHTDPEVFMKDPTSIRLGGGAATPMDGDFDTDSIRYKIRHVLGGSTIDPKAAVASNGTT